MPLILCSKLLIAVGLMTSVADTTPMTQTASVECDQVYAGMRPDQSKHDSIQGCHVGVKLGREALVIDVPSGIQACTARIDQSQGDERVGCLTGFMMVEEIERARSDGDHTLTPPQPSRETRTPGSPPPDTQTPGDPSPRTQTPN